MTPFTENIQNHEPLALAYLARDTGSCIFICVFVSERLLEGNPSVCNGHRAQNAVLGAKHGSFQGRRGFQVKANFMSALSTERVRRLLYAKSEDSKECIATGLQVWNGVKRTPKSPTFLLQRASAAKI